MFDKTKDKIDTLINDRVTSPIRLSVTISLVAFIVAGIALLVVVNNASN